MFKDIYGDSNSAVVSPLWFHTRFCTKIRISIHLPQLKTASSVCRLVSGFGIVDIYPLQIPKNLKYVVDQETCRNSFAELKKHRPNLPRLTDNMFCVGLPEGGMSSCLGDNGGPFAPSDDRQFWAAGIDSWGVDCGKQGTYRVYPKVANYLDWINQTTHDNGGL